MDLEGDIAPSPGAFDLSDLERRGAQRYRIILRCHVRPDGAAGSASWKAIAYDLSVSGIGVALPYPLAVYSELIIAPFGIPGASEVRARVMRVSPVSYLWFCGCELAKPLSDEVLQRWRAVSRDSQAKL
jgi:hypothetical protein